jgi:hypothetical protein
MNRECTKEEGAFMVNHPFSLRNHSHPVHRVDHSPQMFLSLKQQGVLVVQRQLFVPNDSDATILSLLGV